MWQKYYGQSETINAWENEINKPTYPEKRSSDKAPLLLVTMTYN